MNLKCILPGEIKQSQKITYCIFPFRDTLEKAKPKRELIHGCQSLEMGEALTIKGQPGGVGIDGIVLDLPCGGCTNVLKFIELYIPKSSLLM